MKGQILLIDDSELDLKIATSVLEREGFACYGFTDYKEALKWAETNTPQMIFLDLQMPQVTGYQLIPIFKRHPTAHEAPIIIISGKNQLEDVKKAIKDGASDYLVKPVDALVLQEKVSKISEKSSSSSDFATVRVPDKALDSAHIAKKISVTDISEFGLSVRSNYPIEPGETMELAGFYEQLGFDVLFVRCLSVNQTADKKSYLAQFTFVGLAEPERVSLRKFCRLLWVQSKADEI